MRKRRSESKQAKASRAWREAHPERLEADRATARASMNARRARLVAEGLCEQCGKVPPENGTKRCDACREKRREMLKRKEEADPGYSARKMREWRARNAEHVRAKGALDQRRQNYGEAGVDLAALLAAQGGRCAICGTVSPPKYRGGWVLDHDHRLPGRDPRSHRAVLCRNCNSGIGLLGDDPERLESAVRYLRLHRARIDAILDASPDADTMAVIGAE